MTKLNLFSALILICTTGLYAQDMFSARRLTTDPAQNGFPTWSPDSKYIVYQYTDMHDTTGKNGLWKISQDGNSAEQIFKSIAEHPGWSPDGRFIVFDADTGNKIKLIPAEGGKVVSFLPDTILISQGGLPSWSPDASQIAFKDAEYSLCIYNIETGKVSRVFSEEGMVVLPACWTEDGKYILAALMDRRLKKSTIWQISPDGNNRTQITGHNENFYRYLSLSPDGSLLIYGVLEGRYVGLYIMPVTGGISLPLAVTSKGHNEGASWSPDGKKIAFTSTRSGSFDIWVMDVNIEQIKKELGMPYD